MASQVWYLMTKGTPSNDKGDPPIKVTIFAERCEISSQPSLSLRRTSGSTGPEASGSMGAPATSKPKI